MGLAFVTAADKGQFDDGRAWANCWYFEDYRDDNGNHIGYKPCKSPASVEVVDAIIKGGVGMYELFHKPRPNRFGKAVSTVLRAELVKPLDLFGQVDLSKLPMEQDALFVVSFDKGKFDSGETWRNAYGLQSYREDTANSIGFKPMKFSVDKALDETFLKSGIGFYGCEYDTRPTTNAQGGVESLLVLSKASLLKPFDMFGWLQGAKAPAVVVAAKERVAA